MALHEKTDNELIAIATPIMDNLMDGSTERDWAQHTRDFTDNARAGLPEAELMRQCDWYKSRHGDFTERELLGVTRHPDYVSVCWKQRVTKSTAEYLASLTLMEVDGEIRVPRVMVDLWEPNQ